MISGSRNRTADHRYEGCEFLRQIAAIGPQSLSLAALASAL